MKTTLQLLRLSILLLTIFITPFIANSQNHDQIEQIKGSWVGKLDIQGVALTIVLNISTNDKDSLLVTLDSPDQGAKGIATSKVILSNDSLIVKVKAIGGVYKGAFTSDMSALSGVWKQSGVSFPLEMKHQEVEFVRNRPQEPKPPFPYIEEEVVFHNSSADLDLAGTLTRPTKDGKLPVVILISGSGAQNRDEELMGHKPFWVLADYLTRKGIAVLRYDDRGVGKSTGQFSGATTADFAGDVMAAIDYLKTRKEIDTTKIGLIGHSEGGLIAPMVAAQRKDVGLIVLMAGPGLPGADIILLQTELIMKANGSKQEEIDKALKETKKTFAVLKKYPKNEDAIPKLEKLFAEGKTKNEEGGKEGQEQNTASQIKEVTSPWFRYFLWYDPAPVIAKVKCPVLAMNGGKDLQVPPKEDLEAIEGALLVGGNSDYSIELLPDLNHLFQTAKTGSPNEYSTIEETIAPIALDTMGNWLLLHFSK